MSSIPFYLGNGFKSYANLFGNRVIDQSALKVPIQPSDPRVESQFGLIATQDDFESAFSADASLSGSYGAFSAEAKANLSKQCTRSSTRVSIAFTKRVIQGVYRLAEFPIAGDARRTSHNSSKFLLAYGEELITGVGMGGACCYVFQFGFNSEREATEFKIAIGVRYGTGSGTYSQSQKTVISNARAKVSFGGFTTGTTRVPNLFPAELIDGTKFLFSVGFSDSMIAGLLHYFDTFQNNFSNDLDHYAQVLVEPQLYRYLPSVIDNQDEITDTGLKAIDIARALSAQATAIDALVPQLEYMKSLPEYNLPKNLEKAGEMLEQLTKQRVSIGDRTDLLKTKLDIKSAFDFRSQIPVLPPNFCTADPEDRSYSVNGMPFGRWTDYKFRIDPADYSKVCRIEATASISAVRHRPNGGSAILQLVSMPLPAQNNMSDQPLDGLAHKAERVVEEKKLSAPSRGQEDSASVGGFTFVPSTGDFYLARMRCDGNNPGRSISVKTHVGRQLPSV